MKLNYKKMLILSVATLFYIVLGQSKSLSQWIVFDETVNASVIAGFGQANPTLKLIENNTRSSWQELIKVNQFYNQNIGMPASAMGGTSTKAAITAAQQDITGTSDSKSKNVFSAIVAEGVAEGAKAAGGRPPANGTTIGKLLYKDGLGLSVIPTPGAMIKLPIIMRKYGAVEKAVGNYNDLANAYKVKIDALEKDLSQKTTELASATTDAQVQKIQTAISALNTQIAALDAEMEMAANHVKVLALSNENNDKKEADIAALKEDGKKFSQVGNVAEFAKKTW